MEDGGGVTGTTAAKMSLNPLSSILNPSALGSDARNLLAGRIARRLACVSHHEQVRRFAVLDRPLSIEGGELTPTLKLRRGAIEKQYAATIEALYASSPNRETCGTVAESAAGGERAG
jgi:hypothetical protein